MDDLHLQARENRWRIDALDRWRERVDKRIDLLEDAVDGLTTAEKIAQGVANELGRRGMRPAVNLTWWQKGGGLLMGAILIVDAVRGFVS